MYIYIYILLEKLNVSMLKCFQHGCPKFSKQLDIIICIGKQFLMEKMPLLLMPFMMYKFSGTIFSLSLHFTSFFFDYNSILVTMKKNAIINLRTFK